MLTEVVVVVVSLLTVLSLRQGAWAYPPYYDPRVQQQENAWRDFAMWSQPPPRPEYEPSYGYPDYGDYADPRPVYSEMDILREQLARSEPPFNKRFSPPMMEVPPAAAAAAAAAPWDQGTWYDREVVPVQQQQQQQQQQQMEEDNRESEKEKLQRYTEALMEALAREIEESRMEQVEDENEQEEQEQEEDGRGGNDADYVVEELKEAAVKKSGTAKSQPVTTSTSTTAATTTTTTTPLPPLTGRSRTVAAPNNKQGQKEVPLLRPRSSKQRPLTNNNVFAAVVGNEAREATDIKRSRGQLPIRMPRFDLHRHFQPFVAREDDLTQELDSLKKKSH